MNASFAPTIFGSGGNVFEHTTTQDGINIGGKMETADGREFRYVKAGAVALVAGNVLQAPAQITTHDQLTATAAAVGATSVTVTLDATNAVVANQYADGWACIDTTPGEGYMYPIASHPAAAASTAVVLKLRVDGTIKVAWTTATRVTLVPNPHKGVIQSPVTTLTGAVVGVAVTPIAANSYGWVQKGGPCGVLIAGTPAVGQLVSAPSTAAGAAAINSGTLTVIGTIMVTGVDGKILPVMLDIR